MSLKRKRKKATRGDKFLLQSLAQLPVQETIPVS